MVYKRCPKCKTGFITDGGELCYECREVEVKPPIDIDDSNIDIEEFIEKYKSFCDLKYGTQTGAAVSYANALKYLFEYLGFDNINEAAILTVKRIESDIGDKYCVFYRNILNDFSSKGRSSYVKKGWVKASISALYEFLEYQPLSLN